MDASIPDWPEVPEAQFRAAVDTFRKVRRSAWDNAIEYLDEESGQRIGYELGSAMHPPVRFLLHPGLLG